MKGCFVCDKHRGTVAVPGGPIVEDELVYASHMWRAEGGAVYLGYLFLEPKRHVPGLADLTPEEGARIGELTARLSLALRECEGAEHVYAAVIGHYVPHLHVHLAPRYPGTPEDYWFTRLLDWPDAPRGGADEVAAVGQRLREALG